LKYVLQRLRNHPKSMANYRPSSSRYKAVRPSRKTYRSKAYSRRGSRAPRDTAYRGNNPQSSIVVRGTGFPDKLTTNLAFVDSIILTGNAGQPLQWKTYRLSSPYDPVEAIGGGQPTYFDQLATLYGRYIVNGAKITCKYAVGTTATVGVGPYMVGVLCSDQTGMPSLNGEVLAGANNCTYRLCSIDDGTVTVTETYSQKKMFPDVPAYAQSTVGLDPLVNWYAKVWAEPQGISVTTPINVVISIEFNVTFSQLQQKVDA